MRVSQPQKNTALGWDNTSSLSNPNTRILHSEDDLYLNKHQNFSTFPEERPLRRLHCSPDFLVDLWLLKWPLPSHPRAMLRSCVHVTPTDTNEHLPQHLPYAIIPSLLLWLHTATATSPEARWGTCGHISHGMAHPKLNIMYPYHCKPHTSDLTSSDAQKSFLYSFPTPHH
jgi:hypothetical protein